jgi:hypothetical protein
MNLPNGKKTDNVNDYIEAWEEVSSAIETLLDVKVRASNPGLAVVNYDNENQTCELPMWFVRKLLELKK